MTEERLKKANELLERIKEYQKEIASWEMAVRFRNKEVSLRSDDTGYEVRTGFIDFEVVKTLALARLKKDLEVLETEFKNL
jgi:chaperonin cofactor prefoldin